MNINDDIFKSKNSENDDFTEFADDDALYNNQDEHSDGYKPNINNANKGLRKKSADTQKHKSLKSHE